MQDVLLIPVVAAAFVYGWFLMKRLDRFLEANRCAQKLQIPFDAPQQEWKLPMLRDIIKHGTGGKGKANGNRKTKSGSILSGRPKQKAQ